MEKEMQNLYKIVRWYSKLNYNIIFCKFVEF